MSTHVAASDLLSGPREPAPATDPSVAAAGVLGRLGFWCATHVRAVIGIWVLLIVGLGVFAPSVESHLSGAGWQANGSDSVKARDIVDRDFEGLSATALRIVVSSPTPVASNPVAQRAVNRAESLLRADPRVSTVVAPRAGQSISPDGRTVVIQGGAGSNSTEMVRAADDLTGPIRALSGDHVTVALTGSSSLWSDFNKANLSAMLRSEVLSWPVTLAILLLAFDSLLAAGLPLMLTIAGLGASAGVLSLVGLLTHVSVWAMNFALMFALALGIDYALFLVVRFRTALAERAAAGRGELTRHDAELAVAVASQSAGKAVLFSGVTVLVSLSAVMIVPSPAFRSMAFGIMVAVVFVLAATLTLLPAVLGTLGGRINRFALPFAKPVAGPSRRFAAWAELLAHHPWRFGTGSLLLLAVLAAPVLGLRTGMPSITVIPTSAPSTAAAQQVVTDLRAALPAGALVGGANVENVDLHQVLTAKTPLVIGVVLALGFLLLLIALQAPLIAALGVLTNLLAVGAAFGVGRLTFQDGHGATLLGFTPQGFLDAWAPVFFFAMIFAISMDYTVFLLSAAKQEWDRTGDPAQAMRAALGNSGRVVFAAAAVMVAVFFTFALSHPLPPKEMGIVLGVAVLLDAALIRLILLPVLLRLTGRTAWWSPAWLRRILPDIALGH